MLFWMGEVQQQLLGKLRDHSSCCCLAVELTCMGEDSGFEMYLLLKLFMLI